MGPDSYKITEKHNRKPLRNTILKDNNPTTVIPGERVKGKITEVQRDQQRTGEHVSVDHERVAGI